MQKINQQQDLTIPHSPHLLPPKQLLNIYKPSQFGIKNNYNNQDIRVKYIDSEWIHNKKVLDIGCGQGNLSLQLAMRYFPQHILGIDLSTIMIRYANNTLDKCQQQQKSKSKLSKINQLPLNYKRLTNNMSAIYPRKQQLLGLLYQLPDSIIYQSNNNINSYDNSNKQSKQLQYLLKDIDLDLSLGHNKSIKKQFPNNINYSCMNFFQLPQTQQHLYDTILCMSVAKCIHLTFGEEILKLFFAKMYGHLKPQGILIFQLQQYKSYKSDTRNNSINKKNFQEMTLRPKDYIGYFEYLGFKILKKYLHKQNPQKEDETKTKTKIKIKKSIFILYKT